MMDKLLKNKKIAVLMTDGFEEVEFTVPAQELEKQGATVEVVSDKPGLLVGWDHTDWGNEFKSNKTLAEASADEYDGLLLPEMEGCACKRIYLCCCPQRLRRVGFM